MASNRTQIKERKLIVWLYQLYHLLFMEGGKKTKPWVVGGCRPNTRLYKKLISYIEIFCILEGGQGWRHTQVWLPAHMSRMTDDWRQKIKRFSHSFVGFFLHKKKLPFLVFTYRKTFLKGFRIFTSSQTQQVKSQKKTFKEFSEPHSKSINLMHIFSYQSYHICYLIELKNSINISV